MILLPVTLNLFFQAAEDYYDRWEIMSLIRFMRYVAAFVAVALPGLYLALTVYHPELLPTSLALKIATTRQSIPFSVAVEVISMELAFELLREAGVRLPSPVSATIGIVGGIFDGHLFFCHSQYLRGFRSAAEQISGDLPFFRIGAVWLLGRHPFAGGASGWAFFLRDSLSLSLLLRFREPLS